TPPSKRIIVLACIAPTVAPDAIGSLSGQPRITQFRLALSEYSSHCISMYSGNALISAFSEQSMASYRFGHCRSLGGCANAGGATTADVDKQQRGECRRPVQHHMSAFGSARAPVASSSTCQLQFLAVLVF